MPCDLPNKPSFHCFDIFIDKSYEMVKNIIALFCLQFKKNLMNGKYIEQHKELSCLSKKSFVTMMHRFHGI